MTPAQQARYRHETSKPAPSHIVKKCPACGHQAHAKHLAQYGKCVKCENNQGAKNDAIVSS